MSEYKWSTVFVPVTSSWLEEVKATDNAFQKALQAETDRAVENLHWSLFDDAKNRHIGPMHRPTRVEVHEARENLRRWERNDRWKRSAGRYRRR